MSPRPDPEVSGTRPPASSPEPRERRPGRPTGPTGSTGSTGSTGPAGHARPSRPARPALPGQAGRRSRRATQVRRNAFVVAWLVTAAVLAALVLGGPLGHLGTWLPLHALLLGGIGSAITTWSAHFADTLLHRPALGGAALLDGRLAAHSLGTAAVLTGITAAHQALALVGAAIITAQAAAGVVAIIVQYRRAVAPRLAALALHYAAALVLLAVGAVLGYLISWADDAGRAPLADILYLAHTTTMLLGFVGVTVLGTLTVLWPTMLRTPMEPTAPRWAARSLAPLVAGAALVAASGLWQPLAALGAVVYLAGAMGVLVPAFITARRVPPTSFATASAAAAIAWFLCSTGYITTGITLADSAAQAREAIHAARLALGAGFALQILVAALSYLTPVMLGGGPAMTRRTNAIMDRWAAYRVTAANACLALAVTPTLPVAVRATGGILAGAITAYLLVGMAQCGWAIAASRAPGARGAAPPGAPPQHSHHSPHSPARRDAQC
ncbi:hypothetical protein [Actinomyces slackii]|uniref:Uncharacterized protein n=1 Tax=Actinomyces slackii TaxID=52774 RepID=A0A3S4SLU8_9ACTO|nr:hypothetical protein [Actinomyces slackii]VEG75794.1 Uncharacterised protein [Actinomyces slackii]